MNNFTVNLIELLYKHEILKEKSVVVLGNNYISDYTKLETLCEKFSINAWPKDVIEFFNLLRVKKIKFIETTQTWENIVDDYEQADVVFNFGMSGQTFNQVNFYTNMHNRVKNGGILVHSAPWFSWEDTQMFSYSPSFYANLAKANDYEVLEERLGTSTGEMFDKSRFHSKYMHSHYRIKHQTAQFERGNAWGYRAPAYCGVIYKKTNDNNFKYGSINVQEND